MKHSFFLGGGGLELTNILVGRGNSSLKIFTAMHKTSCKTKCLCLVHTSERSGDGNRYGRIVTF